MLLEDTKQEKKPYKKKLHYSTNYTFTIKKEFMQLQPKLIKKELKIIHKTKVSITLETIPQKVHLISMDYPEMLQKPYPHKQKTMLSEKLEKYDIINLCIFI